jgi:minimal PKS acyl carrier protein
MSFELDYTELAALLKRKAGITVDPLDLERPGATFDEFGVDSLGLLAVVGELENDHDLAIATGVESCKSPAEFLSAVNLSVKEGA